MLASRIFPGLAVLVLTPFFAAAQSAANAWVAIGSGNLYGPGKLAVAAWPPPPPIGPYYSGCEAPAGLEVVGTAVHTVQAETQTSPEGPWNLSENLGGYVTSNSAVAAYGFGFQVFVFARGGDNAVWTTAGTAFPSEIPGQPCVFAFVNWTSLGGAVLGDPAVGTNSDGRLEVFAIGTDHTLWHIPQPNPPVSFPAPPPSSLWGDWSGLGGSLSGPPVIGTNLDGRLEVFSKGTDGTLWHIWQTAPGGPWSNWSSLGGVIISNPTVATNADGRLEVFATGTDIALWHIAQSTAGSSTWSGWSFLGGYIVSDPAVGQNADGRLEVFVRGGDNTVWHNAQAQAGSSSWSGWSGLDGEAIDAPAVGVNSDGTLTIFTRSATGAAELTQTAPGVWN